MATKGKRSVAELAARRDELEAELRDLNIEISQRAGEEDQALREQVRKAKS